MLYNIVVSLTFTSYHYSAKAIKQPLLLVMLLVWLSPLLVRSQIPETPAAEQQLENLTENNADAETEDDSYSQQMLTFVKHPININTATADALKELRVLNPLQIQQLLNYRNIFGKFIDIYEMQAIPSFTPELFQKIKYYITIQNEKRLLSNLNSRLKNGEHSILLRLSQTLERAKGFLIDSSAANNFYPGSPQKILVRYKYQFKNLLQYGLIAEKDAGEQFFKGKQKQGFDFYSAHLFARNIGIIKAIALGDFTVNMGQGLIQWQSLAFKKSPDVTAVKRQADILRPYNSATEYNFQRGVGITLQSHRFEATVFGSIRKVDANVKTDTLTNTDDFASSIILSGLHRTPNEVLKRNSIEQTGFGGNISYNAIGFHLGANAVVYNFSTPLIKDVSPYNQYAIQGTNWRNFSADYSYTYRNLHLFGEAAVDKNNSTALLSGLILSLDAKVDGSLVYRNIDKKYQALYGNAFTEGTYPTNEKGLFAGLTIKPIPSIRLDAYADAFSFPWLRYRVDAPTTGSDYLLQLTYRPNKQVEVYTRYKNERKAINSSGLNLATRQFFVRPRQNWRTQVSYKINREVTLKNRVELLWYDRKVQERSEHGFLTYFDIGYKPMSKPYSGNVRLAYFETDSYDSRIYSFENDVLYSFSIPALFYKGYRYYLNLNYDVSKKLTLWARFAQTIQQGATSIGSGLDKINGDQKSEVKLQMMVRF